MKNLYKTFRIILIFSILYSCSPQYIPNLANTPMLKKEDDFNVNIGAGTSYLDIQAAYAVTKDIGLMVNANALSFEETDYAFLEAGIGYFDTISTYGVMEAYFGGGLGSSDNLTFSRLFIQPAIGLEGNIAGGSFGTRIVHVNFFESKENSFFAEPFITGKVGFKYLKFYSQLGVSIPLYNKSEFEYFPLMFNIGVNINLGKIISSLD